MRWKHEACHYLSFWNRKHQKSRRICSQRNAAVEEIEAKAFSIDAVDEAYVKEAKGVVFGAPTYYADTPWQML